MIIKKQLFDGTNIKTVKRQHDEIFVVQVKEVKLLYRKSLSLQLHN